jgi:hypothetical protein
MLFYHLHHHVFQVTHPLESLIVSFWLGSARMLTSVIGFNSLLYASNPWATDFRVRFQTNWSLNLDTLSCSMNTVGQSLQFSYSVPSGSTETSDIKWITGIHLPISHSCAFVLLASQSVYCCTTISQLYSSSWPHGVHKDLEWPVAQSITAWRFMNLYILSTWMYNYICMIGTTCCGTETLWLMWPRVVRSPGLNRHELRCNTLQGVVRVSWEHVE